MIFKDIKFSLGALRLRYFLGGRGISKNAIFCMGLSKMPFLYGVVENAIFVWGSRKCQFLYGVLKNWQNFIPSPFLNGIALKAINLGERYQEPPKLCGENPTIPPAYQIF